MYAYKYQTQLRPIHALPQRRVAPPRVIKKKAKIKKRNPIIEFFRLIVTLSFLAVFVVFVYPTAYRGLVKQVFYPTNIPTQVEYKNSMKTFNPAYSTSINLYALANPTTNYLHNDVFMNQLLLILILKH